MQILRHFFIIFNVFIFNKLRIQWCDEAIHTHESQLSDFQEFYEPGEVMLVTRTPPWWEYLVVQTPQVKGSVHKLHPPTSDASQKPLAIHTFDSLAMNPLLRFGNLL